MLKKNIEYKNFNGETVTGTFYFNLTKAELTEMEVSAEGGLSNQLKKILASDSAPEIYKTFKNIVLAAYGEKSSDGRHFRKSETIKEDFSSTQAFSDLLFSFIENPQSAAEFINGLIPEDMQREIKGEQKGVSIDTSKSIPVPSSPVTAVVDGTTGDKVDLNALTPDQIREYLNRDQNGV